MRNPPGLNFTTLEPVDKDPTYFVVYPGSGSDAVAGNTLFFTAVTESAGAELWKTNGTRASAMLVKEIRPGDFDSLPDEMLAVGSLIYFTADDGIHGRELWRSDGTSEGTILVADVEPGSEGSDPMGLKGVGDKLYFHAHREGIGRELHVVNLPVTP